MASRLAMIVGLALIVIIGFLVVADPFSGDSGGPGPSAIRSLVTYAS